MTQQSQNPFSLALTSASKDKKCWGKRLREVLKGEPLTERCQNLKEKENDLLYKNMKTYVSSSLWGRCSTIAILINCQEIFNF